MSETSLTARERLALRSWASKFTSVTPTIPKAAEWVKESFGKVVPEASIRAVLKRAAPPPDIQAFYELLIADCNTKDDGEISKLYRPGFNRRIDDLPEVKFPSAVLDSNWTAVTLTYSELAMMWFIEQITNKPEWHLKVFDHNITAKWKNEVMAVDWDAVDLKYARFDDAMFVWCLKELQDKAKLYEATGMVPVIDASAAVVKSDCAVTADVKDELKKAVARLEDIPDEQKDWHPGSNEMVLDLVHPSLWPLAYGISRILPNERISLEGTLKSCGGGEVIPKPKEKLSNLWSQRFQWLPCEVELDDDKPRIVSYINNLHPHHHAGLYSVIEKIIAKTLPLWDVVYRWPSEFETQRIEMKSVGRECLAPDVCKDSYCSPDNRPIEAGEEPRQEYDDYCDWLDSDQEPDSDPEVDTEMIRKDVAWFRVTHPVRRPDVPEYKSVCPRADDLNLQKGFLGDTERIQVIVKLANIQLTPEKPRYAGGSWHIEGQLNEHICATALYYYDNENITNSRLAFRTTADREDLPMNLGYEQCDDYSIGRTFKIKPQRETLQELGSVLTCEDRLLTFPNVYQHCVAPFELVDKSKPGHRKILALFLVDPAIPIISTANVPPQQEHWWREGVTYKNMPPELVDMVFDNMDVPINLESAKKMREEVMKERTAIGEANIQKTRSETFNFCEH
ncbi:uncharacterized protein CTRU02_213809 [Colletotrichum truncatum]|uniref:Uncharacterized protein n=1 Tax=Colletotrichum truncatum TaxID=5467 RepID=A0ACC3YGS4_COLTU|nr:uncharacterized protein CTRU02_12831 [Colletotrichum truncatum]KAF6784064.1 hypothetical protein CTRU02_12831 [Colletotrichum truncatum]